ncbi:MAG: hypothetical protein J0M24_06460 [Verrucomicrobia bacterium]|nr:hypothetical protein [Verrucomicrobiota bacterium]
MAKNQKRATVELRWQRLVLVIGLVIAIAGLTVGYVVQRRAHDELGQQIKEVEREIGWAKRRVKEGREQLERSRRKDVLVGRANLMGLGLTDVVSSQRLTIPLLAAPSAVASARPMATNESSTSVGSLANAAGWVPSR